MVNPLQSFMGIDLSNQSISQLFKCLIFVSTDSKAQHPVCKGDLVFGS